MKRYCTICHKIHEGHCPKPIYANRKRNSEADKFRNTQIWKRKAAHILERDLHCCRLCLLAGVLTNRELSVHHIVPILVDYDKRLDDDNLITLCRFHHEQAESGRISKHELKRLATEEPKLPKI